MTRGLSFLVKKDAKLEKMTLISGQGLINLGQRWGSKSPLMHTRANLTEVTSIKSSFEFRTLDPEGVVFYGDTRGGADWFVLALRGGRPEMQIGKADVLTTVTGGPKLDDGMWHKIELRSEGRFVVLELDGEVALVVGLHSQQTQADLSGQIRLSLGGILITEQRLLNPLRMEMDGCVRAGTWLNLSTPWETDLSQELQPCFTWISKGSYFPGTGLAIFNSSDFPVDRSEVSIEMEGYDVSTWNGTVLSLKTSQGEPVLTVTAYNETEEFTVKFGTQTSTVKMEPFHLDLNLTKHALEVSDGPIMEDDTHDWLSMWNEGMVLAFGGVPDGTDDGSSPYLHGCLRLIRIQGQVVDLDRATYKHNSVSSHSCPRMRLPGVHAMPVVGSYMY
ncbi:sex hormone-binding globulin isoform X2 [Megalops cyprinoides]|uniref:sex hormone-binding globulin isoform X2 n=1 Tax=Megalops cyprinoides TaxID=118141 RepID=UPI0018653159|nr:sex hormone-binding globulin isoform X2 [Megalops cyprinoides]